MKQLIRVLVLLSLLLLLVSPILAQGDTFQVTATQMNVRSGPGIEYEVLGQIYSGYSFPIVAYSPTGNWVQLNINGTNAWVFRHLGRVHSSVIMTAPTTTSYIMPSYTVPTVSYTQPSYTIPIVTHTGTMTGPLISDYINSTVGVTASVNVRRGPGLNYGLLTFIPYGQRAVPLARTANATWILLDYNGIVGWVYFLNIAFPPSIKVVSLPVQ